MLSSCEHGTQGNFRECATLAEKYGLKWRYVTEAYFVKDRFEKDKTNAHMILAAKTAKGIGDLNFALSEANISGYYYRPRIDLDILSGLDPKDVFVTTACVGGIYRYGFEEAEKLILTLASRFRGSFMLEIQYHEFARQKEVNQFLLRMYRKHGIPLIMGCDSHFIHPEDKVLRDQRLEANHIVYEEELDFHMDYPTDDEAFDRFIKQGVFSKAQILEAMENTNVFLDFEDVQLDRSRKIPTLYPNLSQVERNQLYRDIVYGEWEKYAAAAGLTEEEQSARLEGIAYEVDTIMSTNMSDYFLLDYEIAKRAKELGGVLTPTGRGSAVSYFTNMLLGLSSVDRYSIPVEMFPDRFISADRILSGSSPDIDLNCGNVEVFQQAQEEVLGKWRSAPMVAYGTLKRLSAWKMYCRANNVPFDTANELSDKLRAYETAAKYAAEEERDNVFDYIPKEYHEYVRMSEKYLGMVDSISPHPCAHLLCTEDIRREIGIYRLNPKTGKKKPVYAAFIDGNTAEAFGYLKNDLLSVQVVKINREAYQRAGVPQPDVRELLRLTQNDPAAWRMYADGLVMGLNQVEQDATREKVMRYKPRNITELASFVAAVRPGFKSMLPVFLERKRFTYGIPAFDTLIQTREMASSFVLFQEQIMKTLQYAGFTAPESYAAIKAISKKKSEKVLPLRERFLQGFAARILQEDSDTQKAADMSAKVWQIIEDTTEYLFNSSHAVCVALDSLYGAYAKAHYPMEYYVTLLRNYTEKGDKERIALVKEEMLKGFGIRVVPCRFRQDNRDYFLDHAGKTISDALASVKHISGRVAEALYDMRNRVYPTFTDLLYAMETHSAFDATNVQALIRMGYFEEFGTAGKLLRLYQEFKRGSSRFSKTHIPGTQQKRLENLRAMEADMPEEEIPLAEQVKFEVEHYGTVVSVFHTDRQYAVLDVDVRYSPKLRLYNLNTGTIGVMKARKDDYKKQPVEVGDILTLRKWEKRPAYRYTDGKPVKKDGVYDLWLSKYTVAQ